MPDEIQRVSIAVVEYEGRYLVGTRGADQPLAGQAAFPGGKCHPNERGAECAVRECREETGLSTVPVRMLSATRHAYPHGTLDLEFWLCRPARGEMPAIKGGYAWVPAEALKSLSFPDANRAVIELLSAGDRTAG